MATEHTHCDGSLASEEGRLQTYPLTSLQIGAMPAYLSILSLHVAREAGKVVLFVDNSPWSSGMHRSKSARLWQLMVTQSRESPFTNQKELDRAKQKMTAVEEEEVHKFAGHAHGIPPHGRTSHLRHERHSLLGMRHRRMKWRSLATVLRRLQARRKAFSRLLTPPNGLSGCVTFELHWTDVRGISYSNELQMDTYLALEMKKIVKREFQSVAQAHAFHLAVLRQSTARLHAHRTPEPKSVFEQKLADAQREAPLPTLPGMPCVTPLPAQSPPGLQSHSLRPYFAPLAHASTDGAYLSSCLPQSALPDGSPSDTTSTSKALSADVQLTRFPDKTFPGSHLPARQVTDSTSTSQPLLAHAPLNGLTDSARNFPDIILPAKRLASSYIASHASSPVLPPYLPAQELFTPSPISSPSAGRAAIWATSHSDQDSNGLRNEALNPRGRKPGVERGSGRLESGCSQFMGEQIIGQGAAVGNCVWDRGTEALTWCSGPAESSGLGKDLSLDRAKKAKGVCSNGHTEQEHRDDEMVSDMEASDGEASFQLMDSASEVPFHSPLQSPPGDPRILEWQGSSASTAPYVDAVEEAEVSSSGQSQRELAEVELAWADEAMSSVDRNHERQQWEGEAVSQGRKELELSEEPEGEERAQGPREEGRSVIGPGEEDGSQESDGEARHSPSKLTASVGSKTGTSSGSPGWQAIDTASPSWLPAGGAPGPLRGTGAFCLEASCARAGSETKDECASPCDRVAQPGEGPDTNEHVPGGTWRSDHGQGSSLSGAMGEAKGQWGHSEFRASAAAECGSPEGTEVRGVELHWRDGQFDFGRPPGAPPGFEERGTTPDLQFKGKSKDPSASPSLPLFSLELDKGEPPGSSGSGSSVSSPTFGGPDAQLPASDSPSNSDSCSCSHSHSSPRTPTTHPTTPTPTAAFGSGAGVGGGSHLPVTAVGSGAAASAGIGGAAAVIPLYYHHDKLVIVRFRDLTLPEELRQIITADLRLLKMLESGLPPWAVFCQSYPVLCQVYRPWMRPLALYIYFIVSVTTVLIGFYDLYKNVPILREALARLLGPLWEWIESWGVGYRLKYLGTMLFLQNCQRAFNGATAFLRALANLLSFMLRPVWGPLGAMLACMQPIWAAIVWGGSRMGRQVAATLWKLGWSLWALGRATAGLLSLLLTPLWHFLLLAWTLVAGLLYPLAAATWMAVGVPFRLLLALLSTMGTLLCEFWDVLAMAAAQSSSAVKLLWAARKPVASSLQVASQASPPASLWRELWNDLFHKVFRAMRSVLNGLILFLLACNRHRLSTYHYAAAQYAALSRQLSRAVAPALGAAHSLRQRISDAPHRTFIQRQLFRESLMRRHGADEMGPDGGLRESEEECSPEEEHKGLSLASLTHRAQLVEEELQDPSLINRRQLRSPSSKGMRFRRTWA